MVQPTIKKNVIKKRTKKFIRFQSDQFKRVKANWRKPRGIDNRCRRKFRGNRLLPGVGYRNDKSTRFMNRDGFKRCVVNNLAEMDALMMLKGQYAAIIGHAVSAAKRKVMIDRALHLGIKVVNGSAKLRSEEKE